jgi:hypothetical protein
VLDFVATNVNPRSLSFSPDESRAYFGSFWVDGVFELDLVQAKVVRMLHAAPPSGAVPQEVTYHGVEVVGDRLLLAANEGRSYLDAFDLRTGALVDRLDTVAKPCCIESIPLGTQASTRVLVSNLGDDTVEVVEVSADGKLASLGKVAVGQGPKRVAFLPPG